MKKTSNLDFKQSNKSSINSLLVGLAAVTLYFNEKANDPFNTYKLIIALILSGWLSGQIVDYYRNNPLKKKTIDFWFNGSSKTNGAIYEILCDHDNRMLTSNGWL